MCGRGTVGQSDDWAGRVTVGSEGRWGELSRWLTEG